MVEATFTEQAVVDNVVNIELVKKWVAIFTNGRGEDNDFIEFADALHELVDAGTFDDIHVMIGAFDFDRDGEVGLMEELGLSAPHF